MRASRGLPHLAGAAVIAASLRDDLSATARALDATAARMRFVSAQMAELANDLRERQGPPSSRRDCPLEVHP